MSTSLRVISLGWGVQSFTLAAMVALGDLPPVDFAINADTGWERSHTYRFSEKWTPWLEAHGVQVVTVTNDTESTKLFALLANGTNAIKIPAFTDVTGDNHPAFFTATRSGTGQLRRQCTHDWKITPMRRYIQSVRAGRQVEQWIGISKDEWTRAKDADVRYITHRWPLLERNMTRGDCVTWLERHGLEVPGKSACTFCPFHDAHAWAELKRQNGHDWQQAVEVDAAIRDKRPPYPLYVHRSCKPLPEAVDIPEDHGLTQPSLFDAPCDSGYCFL